MVLDRELVEGIDQVIMDETRRILTEWLGVDLRDRDQIEREALRLQQLTEDSARLFEERALAEWTRPGQSPDFGTKVQARETAWRAAREMVLTEELYTQVTSETLRRREADDAHLDELTAREHERARLAGEKDRWKTDNVTPNPEARRIVEQIWRDRQAVFRFLAESLVSQRIEDGEAMPTAADDPAAVEVEAMVLDHLRLNPPTSEAPF